MFKPILATFNGRHNKAKSLALITLVEQKQKGLGGLGLKDINLASGVSYTTLKAQLGKWHRWKYVTRHVVVGGRGQPVFIYTVAARGEKFVRERIPVKVMARYLVELQEYRSKRGQTLREKLAALTSL